MWGSSKPKARVYSGFMGDTSPEQDAVLIEFKKFVETAGTNPIGRFDDYDFLRFCRARKFVLKDVQLMWTNFINWRQTNAIDDILQTWDFPELAKIQEIYPQFYHSIDRQGRPVYFEIMRNVNVERLFTFTTEERMLRNFAYAFEQLFALRYPACTEVAGKRIEQSVSIIDLDGCSLGWSVLGLLKTASKLTSDNYPENMGSMYVLHCGFTFRTIWGACKAFVDERTQKKINLLSGSYQKELLEAIDPENLPAIYGGKCTCADKGGCTKSNIGPWTDFELVFPIGIKRKGEQVQVQEVAAIATQLAAVAIEEVKDQKEESKQ